MTSKTNALQLVEGGSRTKMKFEPNRDDGKQPSAHWHLVLAEHDSLWSEVAEQNNARSLGPEQFSQFSSRACKTCEPQSLGRLTRRPVLTAPHISIGKTLQANPPPPVTDMGCS